MRTTGALLTVVLLTGLISACAPQRSDANLGDTNQTAVNSRPQASPLTEFESDLHYVRNGGFTYIWVFARKDGKPLDKEDAAFLRTNAPQVVDWVKTEQGKKVIGGTNFDLEKGNLELLKKRFTVEDYSSK